MIDILGKRYVYFVFSLLLILPGLLLIAFNGLPLSIDFKGGSALEVTFASGKIPSNQDIIALYSENGVTETKVTSVGDNAISIRSSLMNEATRNSIVSQMEKRFNDKITVQRFDSVGPTIGREVTSRAAVAVGAAALAVVVYITMAFRKVQHAFRYGVCAIIAMLHDVLIVISLGGIGSALFGWEIDSLFLTALLSVIGFSVQDKVVVFDRIRENSVVYRRLPFETLVNHSIVQTLGRSINTQLMTVEFLLLSLALFGGPTLQAFCIILLVGLFMGTYSSIFIAAPVLVIWENKEWRRWFHRGEAQTAS